MPETYFWREIDQLRALVTDVVPRCVAALGIHRHTRWEANAVGTEAAVVGGVADEVWLAEDVAGGGAGGQRRVIFQHAVVGAIGHI